MKRQIIIYSIAFFASALLFFTGIYLAAIFEYVPVVDEKKLFLASVVYSAILIGGLFILLNGVEYIIKKWNSKPRE